MVVNVLPGILPGSMVQFPVGRPLKSTLPVETVQVGCVMLPTTGASGVTGCMLIITSADGKDVQPSELVTVKL